MLDIGLQEMIVIGVIALLIFGPSRLPELGRMVGRAMREFRRASDEFRSTVETNLHMNEIDAPPAYTPPASTASEPVADATTSATSALLSEGEGGVDSDGGPAAMTAAESGEPYCAQRGSRLFHRRDCAWVSRIPEIERVYLKSVGDGRDQGFANCPVCEPWEPS